VLEEADAPAPGAERLDHRADDARVDRRDRRQRGQHPAVAQVALHDVVGVDVGAVAARGTNASPGTWRHSDATWRASAPNARLPSACGSERSGAARVVAGSACGSAGRARSRMPRPYLDPAAPRPTVRAMADEEAEFEILSEEGETPEEHDLEILETLEEHGEDLAEPREIRVDLLFPDEESANAAEEELTELGYEVAGFEAAGEEEQWALRATRELRVDRENVSGFRHRFEELAARHDGEFDGWEAAAD
jgi:hypothetical protein